MLRWCALTSDLARAKTPGNVLLDADEVDPQILDGIKLLTNLVI